MFREIYEEPEQGIMKTVPYVPAIIPIHYSGGNDTNIENSHRELGIFIEELLVERDRWKELALHALGMIQSFDDCPDTGRCEMCAELIYEYEADANA